MCSVHRGMFSTSASGGYHDACGDTKSTSGDVQYIGGYHEYSGDIMRTSGGYHDACGGAS